MWAAAYFVVLLALFVRVQTGATTSASQLRPLANEPLTLVMWHHRVFYALLLLAPVEASILGGRTEGRAIGLLLFALGVGLYRVGGAQLGDSLSPFVLPRPTGRVVADGVYAWIRHPMYLGQALLAVGAPMTLGVRWVAWLAVPALGILWVRMQREEDALRARFPAYLQYQSTTRRVVPFLF